jgi:lipopolysaccharide transport system ATP-binding protein
MSSETAIKVENLSKCYYIYDHPRNRLKQFILPRMQRLVGRIPKCYYRKFWALNNVSLEVKKGETVGTIGSNGSGKSTLLQVICGTVSPTSGIVQTHGRVAALLELGAGFNPEFTGRENALLNAAILGFSRENMEDRMAQVLAFSELGEFLDQPIKTYSSGMYARLAFSIAVHVDPEILIVDETLAVGDARFVAKCMRRINDIKNQGATILFVSHDVASVRTLCERAIWLDKGRMVEQGYVFPVTGRYMEFLFKDEQTSEDELRDKIAKQQETTWLENRVLPMHEQPQVDKIATVMDATSTVSGANGPEKSLDSRPVTHWGSNKGIILSASVRDKHGIRKDVHPWASQIEVLISVCVPVHISRDYLSVAFSIKDLKGTDLIVSTTYDSNKMRLPYSERFSASFRLTNFLITGKYLLVAAVENRQSQVIHYYEYLEGAHYFSSLSDERFFGLFQPLIEQQIEVE